MNASSIHRRNVFPFLLLCGLLAASANTRAQGDSETDAKPKAAATWEKLVMHPFKNAQGNTIVSVPLPATWKVMPKGKPGDPAITGPHNIRVIDFPLQMFIDSNDPALRQAFQQSGRLRTMPTPEQLVQQDLVPYFAGQGLAFVRQYEIPELTRIDAWYNDQLYKALPMKMKFLTLGTDWKHANGRSFFVIVHLSSSVSATQQDWGYYSSGLQAEDDHFDAARKHLIFGLANARYNPEQILAYNRSEAEKAGKSWAEFNARLARNQAAFEASQRAHVNCSNAINDSIMQGWRDRNAASDKAQERTIDTITGRENRINPATGELYKVDFGANQYWVNGDGRFISTPDSYDPNLDKELNHHKWDQLQPAE